MQILTSCIQQSLAQSQSTTVKKNRYQSESAKNICFHLSLHVRFDVLLLFPAMQSQASHRMHCAGIAGILLCTSACNWLTEIIPCLSWCQTDSSRTFQSKVMQEKEENFFLSKNFYFQNSCFKICGPKMLVDIHTGFWAVVWQDHTVSQL